MTTTKPKAEKLNVRQIPGLRSTIQSEREAHEKEIRRSEESQQAAFRLVESLKSENNALRDKLMTGALEAEFMRGYIEGQRDLEPPRMVPEVKEQRHFAPNWQAHNMPGQPGQQRDKRWYHK